MTEKALVVLCALGIVADLMNYDGGSVLALLALLVLSLFYLFFGWLLMRHKETGAQVLLLSVLSSIVIFQIAIGILFKLSFWSIANSVNFAGVAFAMGLYFLATTLSKKTKENSGLIAFYKNVSGRLIGFILAGALFLIVPQDALIRFKYRADPAFAELYIKYMNNPDNMELWENLQQYKMKNER
jgi:hypothetical protein